MALNKVKFAVLAVAGLVAVVLTVFQNCAQQTTLSSIEIYRSPFADRKVILNEKSFESANNGVPRTKPHLELTIVVSNACAEVYCADDNSAKDSFTCPAFEKSRNPQLQEQVYDIVLDDEYSYEEAEARLRLAQADNACIRGSTEKRVYSIGALNAADFNDPMYTQQTYLELIGWTTAFTNLPYSTSVGIVDTGIPADFPVDSTTTGASYGNPKFHEDLRDSFLKNYTQRCDPLDPSRYVYCPNYSFREDRSYTVCNPHGLYVAGAIGASPNNSKGIVGIYPYGNTVSALVGNCSGGMTTSEIANAIKFLIYNNPVKVINLSLGGSSDTDATLEDAINQALSAGIVVVAAAGNSGKDLRTNPIYPGAYARLKPGFIAVGWGGVTDADLDSNASFSPDHVEIAAPGSQILTLEFQANNQTSSYKRVSGSSLATPLVAGSIARMIAYLNSKKVYPDPATIEHYLVEAGSRTIASLTGKVKGGRYLDVGLMKAAADKLIEDFKFPPIGVIDYKLRTEGSSTFVDFQIAIDALTSIDMGHNPALAVFDGYIGLDREVISRIAVTAGRNLITVTLNRNDLVVIDGQVVFSIGYQRTVVRSDGSTYQEWVNLGSFSFKKEDIVLADVTTSPVIGAVLGVQLTEDKSGIYALVEGWACQKQSSRPLTVELWSGANRVGAPQIAKIEGRRGVYENCDSLSVDHGFIFQVPISIYSGKDFEVRINHPANDGVVLKITKSILTDEELKFPVYDPKPTVTFVSTDQKRDGDVVNLTGYVCSSSRGPLHVRLSPDLKRLEELFFEGNIVSFGSFLKGGYSIAIDTSTIPKGSRFLSDENQFLAFAEMRPDLLGGASKRAYLYAAKKISGTETEYPEKNYVSLEHNLSEWAQTGWSVSIAAPSGSCTSSATPFRFDFEVISPPVKTLLPGIGFFFSKSYLNGTTPPKPPALKTIDQVIPKERYWVDISQDGQILRNVHALDP